MGFSKYTMIVYYCILLYNFTLFFSEFLEKHDFEKFAIFIVLLYIYEKSPYSWGLQNIQ